MSNKNEAYKKAYGTWIVTTEGDVEGRTTTQLGTYTGYLDEIAFSLAGKCFYSLQFRPAKKLEEIAKPGTKVSIQLDIDSGTWDMSPERRVNFVKNMLSDRNVTVEPGQYYASVILYDGSSPEEIARRENELKRKAALAKLSTEERILLGLEDK